MIDDFEAVMMKMKKTRTLEMRNGSVYYRGIKVGALMWILKTNFGLNPDGKVKITIKEKGLYQIRPHIYYPSLYVLNKKGIGKIGCICIKQFDQLFFKPDGRKRYDIIVKRLKNEKA